MLDGLPCCHLVEWTAALRRSCAAAQHSFYAFEERIGAECPTLLGVGAYAFDHLCLDRLAEKRAERTTPRRLIGSELIEHRVGRQQRVVRAECIERMAGPSEFERFRDAWRQPRQDSEGKAGDRCRCESTIRGCCPVESDAAGRRAALDVAGVPSQRGVTQCHAAFNARPEKRLIG